MTKKTLEGIKIVEWGQFVPVPYCSKLLGDLGAEVIKIEMPNFGDETRRRGPFLNDTPHPERSGFFFYLNTNKLGITLNIRSSKGQKIFKDLIKEADILIEDNPPQKTKDLGLDYQKLSRINPKLVMTSITPFGQSGPYRDFKAHYLNTYHSSGLGYLTPQSSKNSPKQPLKGGGFFGEYACGLISAVGTLAALHAQKRRGRGQHVDVSKQEAILSLCMVQISRFPNEGIVQTRFDNQGEYGDIFPCKDGHIIEMTNEEHEWQGLVELMGNPYWAMDERFKKPSYRKENYEQIYQLISQWMMNHTKEEIYHRGQALGCAVAPVMSAKDIADSQQTKAREFFAESHHPEMGKVRFPSAAYRFSATPWAIDRTAPLLGEHNEEIYCDRLGFTKQELEDMKMDGII